MGSPRDERISLTGLSLSLNAPSRGAAEGGYRQSVTSIYTLVVTVKSTSERQDAKTHERKKSEASLRVNHILMPTHRFKFGTRNFYENRNFFVVKSRSNTCCDLHCRTSTLHQGPRDTVRVCEVRRRQAQNNNRRFVVVDGASIRLLSLLVSEKLDQAAQRRVAVTRTPGVAGRFEVEQGREEGDPVLAVGPVDQTPKTVRGYVARALLHNVIMSASWACMKNAAEVMSKNVFNLRRAFFISAKKTWISVASLRSKLWFASGTRKTFCKATRLFLEKRIVLTQRRFSNFCCKSGN